MGSITTDHTAAALRAWPRDRPVRIVDSCRTLALGILAEALFGLELEGDRTPVHEAADDILARMDLRSVSAYLPEWVPTPRNVRFRRAIGTLHERLDSTVDQQRQNEVIGENLLSIMLAAGLDPETIRDELIAFLFAGYDSTATALSCTLGLLAEHTETQSALRSELRSTVGDRSPTPEDLQDLHLLDTVVRESLRLYPPQYILFREPTENVALGGYRIKAGTTLVLPPWLLHRDERFWEAPTAFRPERWKGDDIVGSEQPAYTYIPYGGGPRHCLGASLANQTLRLVTAMVCQRFKLRSAGSLSVTAGPTLSVDEELELKLEQV